MPSFEQMFMPEYTEQRLRLLRVSAQAAESLAKGKNTTRLWDTAREAIAEYAKTLDIDPESSPSPLPTVHGQDAWT